MSLLWMIPDMDEIRGNRISGKGKLLLFGEHSAVYGYPALGVPLPLETLIIPRSTPGFELIPEHRKYTDRLNEFILFAETRFGIAMGLDQQGFLLQSTIPPESGLGSSAALCTALVRYLYHMNLLKPAGGDDLWFRAHQLEVFFHGTPSGIDTGLSTGRGPGVFYFSGKLLPTSYIVESPGLHIVYGALPRSASARSMIQMVNERVRVNPQGTKSLLEKLGSITEQAVDLFKNSSSPRELGALAIEAQNELKKLGVSTDMLNQILELALRAGSPGGKMSGAGGGGAFWFLAESREQALSLKGLIQREVSCPLWIMNL